MPKAKTPRSSSNTAMHRKNSQGLATARIRLSQTTADAVNQYAQACGMTADTVVWQLIEFYRLERLDLVIDRLHSKYLASGITPIERSHLSVLYTLLGEIDRLSGL